MSASPRIYVFGIGMITPVGLNAAMTAASIRAEYSAIEETSVLNKKLKPIKMASVPEDALPAVNPALLGSKLSSRQLRLLQLASVALLQLENYLPQDQLLPLFLSLPEHIPGLSLPMSGNVIEQLTLQSGIAFNMSESRVAEVGRAGGLYAVAAAHQYLSESGNDYVLIGGMDTYWDTGLLARLDAEDRLMLDGNVDGFFPGEGAAFLLLASERVKADLSLPLISLAKPGLAHESGHRYSEEPYRGDGMATAVTQALGHAPGVVDSLWSSMIYDGYAAKELGVALTRNHANISPHVSMTHPVDCVGDMGAAMGCTLIALVAMEATRSVANRHHLLCCSSDLSHRAALRIDIE